MTSYMCYYGTHQLPQTEAFSNFYKTNLVTNRFWEWNGQKLLEGKKRCSKKGAEKLPSNLWKCKLRRKRDRNCPTSTCLSHPIRKTTERQFWLSSNFMSFSMPKLLKFDYFLYYLNNFALPCSKGHHRIKIDLDMHRVTTYPLHLVKNDCIFWGEGVGNYPKNSCPARTKKKTSNEASHQQQVEVEENSCLEEMPLSSPSNQKQWFLRMEINEVRQSNLI